MNARNALFDGSYKKNIKVRDQNLDNFYNKMEQSNKKHKRKSLYFFLNHNFNKTGMALTDYQQYQEQRYSCDVDRKINDRSVIIMADADIT